MSDRSSLRGRLWLAERATFSGGRLRGVRYWAAHRRVAWSRNKRGVKKSEGRSEERWQKGRKKARVEVFSGLKKTGIIQGGLQASLAMTSFTRPQLIIICLNDRSIALHSGILPLIRHGFTTNFWMQLNLGGLCRWFRELKYKPKFSMDHYFSGRVG